MPSLPGRGEKACPAQLRAHLLLALHRDRHSQRGGTGVPALWQATQHHTGGNLYLQHFRNQHMSTPCCVSIRLARLFVGPLFSYHVHPSRRLVPHAPR